MWFWIMLIGVGLVVVVISRQQRSSTTPPRPTEGSPLDHRVSPSPSIDPATAFVTATALHQGLAEAQQSASLSCDGSDAAGSGDSGCGDSGGGSD
ncbi:MAG: hypothetical protein RL180_537 [Pseudomonadota bacterium]